MQIQFSHANGFGAATYQYFFELLQPYNVSAVELIGHGDYSVAPGWIPLATELIEYIENYHQTPVIGMGHSLGGAITLYAAQQRPDLFKQLIFLDPPIFAPFKRTALGLLKKTRQYDKITPAGRAKMRKQHFKTKEEAFEYFKPKTLFKNFDPKSFENYINNGLKSNGNEGFELAFSREIEYQVFREFPKILKKLNLQIPSQFIYSQHYNVLWKTDIKWLKTRLPNTEFISFEGGHLFPLEYPQKTADLIKSLIKD